MIAVDKRHKPKIERAGSLGAPQVLAAVVGESTEDIAGADHLAFGYEQVLERFENIDDSVLTTNIKKDVGIGVHRSVRLRLDLGRDSGYRPGGGCLDGCTCRRHEVHPLVDAFRVLGGGRRCTHGAIIGIHEDFGSVIERRIQDDRRVWICRGGCISWWV